MSDLPKNIGATFVGAGQVAHHLVAGNAQSDNAEKEGAVIDRLAHGNALSAKISVPWSCAAITATKTLKATLKRYQSADGSNWDAAETLINAQTLLTGSADPEVLSGSGVLAYSDNLEAVKRYVKYSMTMDLNHTDTDNADYGMVVELGGQSELPAV